MRLCPAIVHQWSKIGVLFLVLALSGCNATKNVGEDEFLLSKNTIVVDGEKVNDETVKNLILQKPNTSVLGYPLRLNLYNLAKKNPDSSYQAWLKRREKRQQRLENKLSKKQVQRLGQSFLVKGYSDLFQRVGEPPSIIDTTKTRKSTERLHTYYYNKGFFNNTVNYSVTPTKRKMRGEITYGVQRGNPYFIDSLTTEIRSSDLDSLYQTTSKNSRVKNGQQFDFENFTEERQRLTSFFKNSGIYNFQESSINFDVYRDTLQLDNDQKIIVKLNIKESPNTNNENSSSEYSVHRFKAINIFADYAFDTVKDSLNKIDHEGYTIWYDGELKYHPKALTDAIFFEKDSIYRELDRTRTLRQITNLNTFKYPNIGFEQDTLQSKLISNIYLAPRPKFSLGMDFDISRSNIQQLGAGIGASIISRNTFGGSETLSLSVRTSLGVLSDNSASDEAFTSEIGGDINLSFPRIWFPFNTQKIIPNYMLPQTRFSAGTTFQKNIGLDRQSLNSVLSYNWSPSDAVKNTFELLNIEFVRNTNTKAFFNEYSSTYDRLNTIAQKTQFVTNPDLDTLYLNNNLTIPEGAEGFIDSVTQPGFIIDPDDLSEVRSIEERKQRLTENNLIYASSFTFQKNNRRDINDNDFYQFRMKLESAGNMLALMENIFSYEQNNNGKGLVFGIPYTQYVKTEFDYIKHWQLRQSVLAFRSFFGLAIPYGNSESVPFVRSYFAGGSNDNRAWNVYSLGPGRTDNLNDFNEANMKIGLNLEYRFPIVGDIKGAFFADAGNIWNVFDNVEDKAATFNGLSSLEDIALGTGLGLRYDFTFFVIRLDMGLKTYNPVRIGSDRWFSNFNLNEAVLNIGINYPF